MEPEQQQPTPPPFRFTDPRQERIHRRLLLIGSGPAAFYKDACELMSTSNLLGSTAHLVAHLLREIESALRDVAESLVDLEVRPRCRVHPVRRIAAALRKWTRARGIGFRDFLLDRIGLLDAVQSGHRTEVKTVLRALDLAESDPVAKAWLELARRRGGRGLHGRAHRKDLSAPLPVDADFLSFWDRMQLILDVVLDRFETRYNKFLEVLDQLLSKSSPSRADITLLRNHLPNSPTAQGYFFDRLTSPDWLEPLRKAGLFKRPAPPEEDPDGGGFRLPGWPQSRYVARMGKDRPKIVLEIILQAEPTRNGRVHADFLDAAKEMPSDLAARLVPSAVEWFESGYGSLLLFDKMRDLVLRLAESKEVSAALDLAHALLALSSKPRESGSRLRPEPIPRFDAWFYGDVLDRVSPVLTRAARERWLSVLCNLLRDAVQLSLIEDKSADGIEDYSHAWRPAIEDHQQNEPQHPVTDRLIAAVRDAAAGLAAQDASAVPRIVASLEAQPFKIFRRIALHFLRRYPDAGWGLIVERLTNREYFDDVTLRHEYYHLLKECFGRLEPAAQAVVLRWIEEGPDVGRIRARFADRRGKSAADEEVQEEIDYWRFKRLLPLRDTLTGAWRERCEQLATRFGEPEHPDFVVYSSGGVSSGVPSPKSMEELGQLPLAELIEFLKRWEPSGGLLDASPEGLGQDLTALVASDPERFAAEAPRFKDLDPTYVRAVVEALARAAKEGYAFPWTPVLDLCEWIVAQRRDRVDRKRAVRDADPNWGWARKAVVRLLGQGMTQGDAEIPMELRSRVWAVLRVLTDDPEPTPEHEAKYGGSNMDPPSLSINTVRGDAMHAAVKYGLWLRRYLDGLPDAAERVSRGFDEMPELREALNRHLDPSHEPALAIRAVYGQWFPWLALLDHTWARDNAKRIFPMEERSRPLWDAAWNTYARFCRPYDNVVPLLREEYRHAVELIGTGSRHEVARAEDPERRLAEHLMRLYLLGRIGLKDPGGLLERFYGKASAELRAYALEYVGRALSNTTGDVDAEILNRLKELWAWRLSAARESGDVAAFGPELAAFGWWFRAGKFEDAWAIAQLKAGLETSRRAYRDSYMVMEGLAEMAQAMPFEAVECSSLLIDGDDRGWLVATHREELRKILQKALGSAEDLARRAATELVNRLLARGEIGFRDLLPGS